jgi:hypothetical protein
MFWNAGPEFETEFLPVGAEQLGDDFVEPMVGRGASYADIDLDGDLDLLITSTGRAPRLLRNDQETDHHWLRLKLVGDGEKCNRDAIGAWVSVTVGDEVIAKQVMPTRSYLTQVELPLTFGLGEHDSIDNVSVQWPDGEVVEMGPIDIDQSHEITR